MNGNSGKPKENAHAKFRCKVGGEWKELDSFSNTQQKLLQSQLALGKFLEPAHSGMTCKDHTAGSRTQLLCEMCGLRKPIDDFSKSSRRNAVYNCKRCAAWIETQEPDVTPAPLETGHISAEEVAGKIWTERFFDDTDFFAGESRPRAPITAPESLGLGDLAIRPGLDIHALIEKSMSSNASTADSSSASTTASRAPPHLRKKLAAPEQPAKPAPAGPKHPAAPAAQPLGRQLPPHLRGKVRNASAAATKENPKPEAVTQASASDTCSTASFSTATTLRKPEDQDGKTRCVAFNAWDTSGKRHLVIKSKSKSTDAGSTCSSSITPDGLEAGWQTPGPVRPLAMGEKGKGKWPKASEVSARMSTNLPQ
ncbi:hypothetical protein ESCO_001314 [Escovopsis weberi]|uniref:Stc1 domain-containing protein n=1 Tax=Escovopsis weberi TaxID=150374 RepID=A0A0M9VT95_ESCWE|nr:hypothetical protein ESCO_001314 [Escovopsis weberi]